MNTFLKRAEWRPMDYVALIITVLLTTWVLSKYMFPTSQWISVEQVRVFNSNEGTPARIEVARTLHLKTDRGRYEVDVRDASTNLRECIGIREVPYNAEPTSQPIVDRTWKWWAYSGDLECYRKTLLPGQYYMLTRHCWRRFWWVRETCSDWVPSNVWTVHP